MYLHYYPLGIFFHVCIISDIIPFTIGDAYDNALLIYNVTLIKIQSWMKGDLVVFKFWELKIPLHFLSLHTQQYFSMEV